VNSGARRTPENAGLADRRTIEVSPDNPIVFAGNARMHANVHRGGMHGADKVSRILAGRLSRVSSR
jgi:hypothetical protein